MLFFYSINFNLKINIMLTRFIDKNIVVKQTINYNYFKVILYYYIDFLFLFHGTKKQYGMYLYLNDTMSFQKNKNKKNYGMILQTQKE